MTSHNISTDNSTADEDDGDDINPGFDAASPDGLAPLYIKRCCPHGPMYYGDKVRVTSNLELELVYCEDMHPVFRGSLPGETEELWTESFTHRGFFYRAGLWPSDGADLDKLHDKVARVMCVMDEVISIWSREAGRA